MLQLILDLLKGITPLSGSAWTRLIFFIICIKNKSMKKKTGGVRLVYFLHAAKICGMWKGKQSLEGSPHLS